MKNESGKPKNGDGLQISRIPADNEGHHKPDRQQSPGQTKILLPILFVLLRQLHVFL